MKTMTLMTVSLAALQALAAADTATLTSSAPTPAEVSADQPTLTTPAPAAASADAAAPAAPTPAAEAQPSCCIKPDCGCEWLNIETVTLAAENGDPLAQYTIAWLSDTGSADTPKDEAKANEYYAKAAPGLEKAAKEGCEHAARALSRMYAEGKGVVKDAAKAAEFRAHAEKCRKDGPRKHKHGCGKPKDGCGKSKNACGKSKDDAPAPTAEM
ncbi:MAG: tetratricopeptide repeat protein [Akkermansia sp.]